MSARTESIAHLTCDQCGKQQDGPGIVGWWHIGEHPDGVSTARFDKPWPPYDLCSWGCVAAYALHRSR